MFSWDDTVLVWRGFDFTVSPYILEPLKPSHKLIM